MQRYTVKNEDNGHIIFCTLTDTLNIGKAFGRMAKIIYYKKIDAGRSA